MVVCHIYRKFQNWGGVVKNIIASLFIFLLEWYVIRIYVVLRIFNARAAGSSLGFVCGRFVPPCTTVSTAAASLRAELHPVCDNFRAIFFLSACFVVPASRLQTPFNKNGT